MMDSRTNTGSHYLEYNVSSEIDPQITFHEALSTVNPKKIYPLDSGLLLQQLNHSGMPTQPHELPQTPGLYLDSSIYSELDRNNQLPLRCAFENSPLSALGREDSRHSVFFGNLALRNYSSGPDLTIPVAVKPFLAPAKHNLALHEYAMYEYLDRLGIEAPKQLGLLTSGQEIYTISEFAPEILTLDSLDWANLDQETIDDAILRGVETLVILHTIGVFHGDAAFRNLTLQPNRNAHWIVDLETAISTRDSVRTTPDVDIVQLAINDLADLIWSLTRYQIIDPSETPSKAFQAQYDKVLLPYRRLICETTDVTETLRKIRSNLHYIDDYFYHYIDTDEND